MPEKRSRSRAACGVRYRHLKRGSSGSVWRKRDRRLMKLGFASYRDYLHSPLWKAIRSAKLELTPKCELCEASRATQVHHLRYSLRCLKGIDPLPLVSACPTCHEKVEFTAGGKKRGFLATRKATKRLLMLRGNWEQHVHPKRRKSLASGK